MSFPQTVELIFIMPQYLKNLLINTNYIKQKRFAKLQSVLIVLIKAVRLKLSL